MINKLFNQHQVSLALIGLLALAGCVSKDDPPTRQVSSSASSVASSASSTSSSSPNGNAWTQGVFPPADQFVNRCENPRSGIAPYNGQPYPDEQGTFIDENNFLRSVSNDLYLWYDEITDRNPMLYTTPNYFDLLKTNQLTPTGAAKDQFHWSEPTAQNLARSEGGVSAGYGIRWALLSAVPPREAVVVYTEPGSPADEAGIERGARVQKINGVDLVGDNTNAGIDTLNEGLYPSELGVTFEFEILDLNADTPRTVSLTTEQVNIAAVQDNKVIETPTGKVGYMVFNAHIAPAEAALKVAIEQMETDGASDLILDLRYNGGGFLYIASQLGYMIAGSQSNGAIFDNLEFNDKHPTHDPVTNAPLEPEPFYNTTLQGNSLPTLNLSRVFVLAGGGTCSASEAIINALGGIDVEVILIGNATCGKPYGAYMLHNCGASYYTTQFRGSNDKGWGDYSDGFFPGNPGSSNPAELAGCQVNDDFNNLLGDPNEARLAAALYYRENGSCPAGTVPEKTSRGAQQKAQNAARADGFIYHPPGLGDKIMRAPQ
ncbi:MAG TPA: S41 family peptidase [Cellvibrionaceae bacterium]